MWQFSSLDDNRSAPLISKTSRSADTRLASSVQAGMARLHGRRMHEFVFAGREKKWFANFAKEENGFKVPLYRRADTVKWDSKVGQYIIIEKDFLR